MTIGGQTVIEPCIAKNDVPNIEYNFVPITDIQNVDDKDKIDVLVICTKVEACVTQALKSGRETKKREIRVTDNSKAEIMMTLWGENAEKYDKATLEGKVLAARSVMVTDWNGKSLSCTFGSSLELNPKIPEAEDLKKINLNDTNIQSLSTDRFKPNVEASFVCLRQIHQEFEDSSVQAKYYNLTAYLTDLRSDKIMYKACPGDKCNKMVTDLSNGQYKCEKCRLEFPEFHWRYILRGAIADATDYQVKFCDASSSSSVLVYFRCDVLFFISHSLIEINFRLVFAFLKVMLQPCYRNDSSLNAHINLSFYS